VDPITRELAATAAMQLYSSLVHETRDDKNFQYVPPGAEDNPDFTTHNPYTDETRVTSAFLVWSSTHSYGRVAQQLPTFIRSGEWDQAFRCYRRLLEGLDLWVADQLRKKGKGTAEEAVGNAHQHYSQLRTGLEQIAEKHGTRLPALFHPAPETVAKERDAGRPAADTVPMNVYFWKDAKDGKFHVYDLTTPSRPHEQVIGGPPTAANLATFFEEVARYPEGEVRYTLPGGGAGVAATTGKTKWYEWIGYAGLALAAVGLGLLTAGASIPATVCFAAGAVAGGLSAGGHLVDTAHLGTATTATVVLDVAQIVASFASFGAMGITIKTGSAAAALSGSRWFVPLVTGAAGADVVQLVALTDITHAELVKIQNGAGSPEDKQRAMSVLITQLIVMGGLTALSVQGARGARSLAGQQLEVVEQNGVKVLRVAGEATPEPVPHRETKPPSTAHDTPTAEPPKLPHDAATHPPATTGEADRWLASLEHSLTPEEKAKLIKMRGVKTPQQTHDMFAGDLDGARERVRTALRADHERAAVAAQSKERVAELRTQIAERGLMNDPDIQSLVSGKAVANPNERLPALRDKLVAKILRAEAEQAHPGSKVIDNVKIYEKLPEASLDEWKAKNPNRSPSGLTERDDGLYIQRGEIDMMIVEPQPGGKARVAAREEVKTGARDTSADARKQIVEQTGLLRDAAAGKKQIRLEAGGEDITGQIDLASDAAASKSTRGLAGKGFDKSLGVAAGDLEALCKELLANHSGSGGASR
jgi:hypothetical protein